MKKIIIALILVAIVFSVCGCSKTKKDASGKTDSSSVVTDVEPVSILPDEEIDNKTTKSGKENNTTTTTKTENKNSTKKSEKSTKNEKETTTQKVETNTPSSKYDTPIVPID